MTMVDHLMDGVDDATPMPPFRITGPMARASHLLDSSLDSADGFTDPHGAGAGGPSADTVTPGQALDVETTYLKGHGTFLEDGQLLSSVAGTVYRVNKLVSVKAIHARYSGEIGDVVVGRIMEVGSNRWCVDISARQSAILLLSSVNLPTGIHRRSDETDEAKMRSYFREGDVLSCEVQGFYQDGAIALHTRSLKYGKLADGVMVAVPSALVKRLKSHFVVLDHGVSMILGLNGYVWISRTPSAQEQKAQAHLFAGHHNFYDAPGSTPTAAPKAAEAVAGADEPLDPHAVREQIVRVRNCILGLVERKVMLTDQLIAAVSRTARSLPAKQLLDPDVMDTVILETREQLQQHDE